MAHDTDPFNRWEAGQRLATRILLLQERCARPGASWTCRRRSSRRSRACSRTARAIPAFAAEALTLPRGDGTSPSRWTVVDPDAIHAARQRPAPRAGRSAAHATSRAAYARLAVPGAYSPDAAVRRQARAAQPVPRLPDGARRRRRRARCAFAQFERADNMTDAMAALTALANSDCPEREPALTAFYAKWKDEPLVVDKWLARAGDVAPARRARRGCRRCSRTRRSTCAIPNKVYALIRSFGYGNHVRFHAADGSGYALRRRPGDRARRRSTRRSPSRMARAFDRWKQVRRRPPGARPRRAGAHPRRRRAVQGRRRDREQVARLTRAAPRRRATRAP